MGSSAGQRPRDINTLLQFELLQASGGLLKTFLTSATDLQLSNSGTDLSLTRLYDGTLLSRNSAGLLGNGWKLNFDVSAIVAANGDVLVQRLGSSQKFSRNVDGGYAAQLGSNDKLSAEAGLYVLTDIDGIETRFGPDGRFVSSIDTNGNAITAVWTGDQLTTLNHSDGQALTFSYNRFGRIASASDDVGRVTHYSYDETGTLLTEVENADGITRYSYNATGQGVVTNALSEIRFADGTTYHYEYNQTGQLASEFRTGGVNRINYDYVAAGKVIVTDAVGIATALYFDSSGLLSQVEDAQGNVSQIKRGVLGNIEQFISADGSKSKFSFDDLQNLTSSVDALGGRVIAKYRSGTDALEILTDQLNQPIKFNYDDSGNLIAINYIDGTGTRYEYGQRGLLSSVTNGRGARIELNYDSEGRLTHKLYSDGTYDEFAYDARGKLVTARAREGNVTSYRYDLADRLTSQTDGAGRTLGFDYDSLGRRIERHDPDGTITRYTYDAAGRLEALRTESGEIIVRYTYDNAGKLIVSTKGNGARTEYNYDEIGRTTSIVDFGQDNIIINQTSYSFDVESRPITLLTKDGMWDYNYNSLGQLTRARFESFNINIANIDTIYEYDAVGNRISTTDKDGTRHLYVVNQLNQYIEADGFVLRYDLDGNRISKNGRGQNWIYKYDDENRLIEVTNSLDNWKYEYDVFGNRTSTTKNGVTENYVLDYQALSVNSDLPSIVQTYDSSNSLTSRYQYGINIESQNLADGSVKYFSSDLIGNVVLETDSLGSPIGSFVYDPFGKILLNNTSSTLYFGHSGAFGIYTDGPELSYFRRRVYDSDLGRFLSRDPINISDGTNLYSYVNSGVTYKIDPTGLLQEPTREQDENLAIASAVVTGVTLRVKIPGTQVIDTLALAPDFIKIKQQQNINEDQINDARRQLGLPDTPDPKFGSLLDEVRKNSSSATTRVVPIRRSSDPNDIVGPSGFGEERFVAARDPQAYVINFENLATATGAARHVEITQQLDPDLDSRTFRLTGFGFDIQSFDLPGNRAFYSGRIDLSATKGYLVDVTATVDVAAGTLLWVFDTIDPATGQTPLDADVGFLLPNDPTHRGEGFVSYIIRPKANVVSGDRIDSQARIVFDTNEPIDTPAIFNTIDAVAPTSLVSALPAESEATTFEVSWSGVDDSSGAAIADYTIYASRDGEPPTIWLSNTVLTNALFFGETGHTYAFSVTARDNAGNEEAIHATPDTVIRIGPPDRVDGQTYILSKEEPIVTGTRGDDKFVARAGVLSSRSEIDGAGGRNSLILQGGGRFDLRAPAKLLNVAIVEAQEGQAAFRQNDGTVLPDTRQTIQLRDGQNVTVNVASTDVDPLNPSVPTITIFGANGANVINLGSGNAQVLLGSANETVLGGGGNNSFTVTAATSRANIDGGSGASELIVAGGGTVTLGSNITRIASVSLSSSATGVTQTDYVFTANAIDGLSIVGSKGSDAITIQRASQSVLAGDGDDRIIVDAQGISAAIDGGSGRNILEVMQGGTFTLNAATRNVELLLNQASSIRFESGRTLSFRGSTGADNYLSSASGFIGTSIVGFDAGGDIVSISDIALSGKTKLRYRENANRLGGTLAISDGKRETSINLVGHYTQSLFRLSANGTTGVSISYAPIAIQSARASSTVAGSFADVFTEASNEQSIQFQSLPVFDNETFGQLKRTAQTAKEQVLFDAGQSTSRISAFAGQLAEAIAAFDTQNGGLNYGLGSDRQSHSNLYFSNRYEHHQLQ